MVNLVIVLALVLYISLDDILAGVEADRVSIVTTGPEVASVKEFFHFLVLAEYFPGSNTFYDGNNLAYGHIRYPLHQEVNVVLIRTYFYKANFIGLFYI